MLYLPSASPEPLRIQGSLVTGREIRQIVNEWRQQDIQCGYSFDPSILAQGNIQTPADLDSDDALLQRAREIVIRYQIGSTSLLQRKLKVGFSRAGRLMDVLEEQGIVGPSRDGRARDVLMTREEAGLVRPIDTPPEDDA
jgi:S-DNA-T family DNA segregation ATPase FtsK/SpoIIIE